MTWAAIFKFLSGVLGVVVAVMFPTELLQTLMYCLIAAGAIDCITGIAAALEKGEPVTPRAFIKKAMKKATRGMAYLGMASICGHLLKVGLELGHPVLEPFGAVLGALIGAEMVSILRNLSIAKLNIPVLDRLFRRLIKNLNEQVAGEAKPEDDKAESRT